MQGWDVVLAKHKSIQPPCWWAASIKLWRSRMLSLAVTWCVFSARCIGCIVQCCTSEDSLCARKVTMPLVSSVSQSTNNQLDEWDGEICPDMLVHCVACCCQASKQASKQVAWHHVTPIDYHRPQNCSSWDTQESKARFKIVILGRSVWIW